MKKHLLFLRKKTLYAFLLLFTFFSQNVSAQNTTTFTSGNGVWYVPCGVTSITVEAWGGGGRGGKRTTSGEGGGGGGGAYVRTENIPVSNGDFFNYQVGAGASGGTLEGGDSWFNSATILMAKGGKGVQNNNTNGAAGGSESESVGVIKFSGGKGGNTYGGLFAGGGGGAGHYNGNGGDAFNDNNGGGSSVFPGGYGANGGGGGYGDGNNGFNYGGGGGGAISWLGRDREGGKGAGGFIRITYTVPVGTDSPVEKVQTISQSKSTDVSCSKTTVNLIAAGGNIGAGVSTLWYNNQGTCPSFKGINEFMKPTLTYTSADINNTTVGTLSSGNRQFTSTTDDPGINMLNVLTTPIDPAIYKYMIIRYKVLSEIEGGEVQIYYNKNGLSEDQRVNGTLISDKKWHIMTIDMTSRPGWNNDDNNITGWRFDYATNSGVTIELDYIMLGNVPILENTNEDDSKITQVLTDASATKAIAAVRVADQQAQCNDTVPVTGCESVDVDRIDRTFQASGGNWGDSANWTPTALPNLTTCVNIPDGKFVTVDNVSAQAESLTVQNSGKIVIPSEKALTVQNGIINNDPSGSNFIVKSDGNLIQLSNAVNTGNITAERNVTDMNNISTKMDYVYWSSPVLGQQTKGAGGFSPGTPNDRFFRYNEPNDRFYETGDPTFVPGKGYAVRAETGINPDTGLAFTNPYAKDYKFKGVPNNGEISININRSLDAGSTQHGFNLVGNPYPSNIDFAKLYAANSTLIFNNIYFWTNNTFTAEQQGSGYGGNNYAIYTGTGGNPATGGTLPAPTGIIKVGQGFIIQKREEGGPAPLVFKNSYGSGQDLRVATSGTFYQKSNEAKNRFWLKLISPDEMVNTQLIGYVEGATNDFEQDYDAEAFGLSSDLFYSMSNGKRLLIQGKAAQFSVEDRVILGANFFKNQEYKIAIEQPEGIFEGSQNVYLKDKQTGVITNLSQNSYTFTTDAGENTGRFEIIYKPETILVTDSVSKDQIVVYRDQDNFVIQSPKTIASVEVYEMSGKLFRVLKPNSKQAVLEGATLARGIYILHIKATDGEVTNKKIIR